MTAPPTTFAADFRQKAARMWHAQRVKALVRDHLGLGPQALISVAQVDCDQTQCPGPATQITLLTLDMVRRVHLIHRPLAEVTAQDLAALRL